MFNGEPLDYEEASALTIPIEHVEVERFRKRARQRMANLPIEVRLKGFNEVELGFTEPAGLAEADRCFQCGLFPNKKKNESADSK